MINFNVCSHFLSYREIDIDTYFNDTQGEISKYSYRISINIVYKYIFDIP